MSHASCALFFEKREMISVLTRRTRCGLRDDTWLLMEEREMGTPMGTHSHAGTLPLPLLGGGLLKLRQAVAAALRWAAQPAPATEVLVVDNDAVYRDHVLVPSLAAMGFTRIHRARSAASAERQLRKHRGIAVVVTDAALRNGEDGLAVCRLAKAASIPVVLLTSLTVPDSMTLWLADKVLRKSEITMLEAAQEVRKAARQPKASA